MDEAEGRAAMYRGDVMGGAGETESKELEDLRRELREVTADRTELRERHCDLFAENESLRGALEELGQKFSLLEVSLIGAITTIRRVKALGGR